MYLAGPFGPVYTLKLVVLTGWRSRSTCSVFTEYSSTPKGTVQWQREWSHVRKCELHYVYLKFLLISPVVNKTYHKVLKTIMAIFAVSYIVRISSTVIF